MPLQPTPSRLGYESMMRILGTHIIDEATNDTFIITETEICIINEAREANCWCIIWIRRYCNENGNIETHYALNQWNETGVLLFLCCCTCAHEVSVSPWAEISREPPLQKLLPILNATSYPSRGGVGWRGIIMSSAGGPSLISVWFPKSLSLILRESFTPRTAWALVLFLFLFILFPAPLSQGLAWGKGGRGRS